ncbi:MAG TPA: pyridoxal phosphate-dependent aminotransferase [Bacillales bacterium]|nr:pyridoxal phosphate-dependent aminotransferase [Bacillales bacterium]
MELSRRVKTITPSSTLAITAKANELKEQGYDVIGLGAGEPDFNTPQPIIEAAYEAVKEGWTKYTPAGGLPRLKKGAIEQFKRDHGLEYEQKEIFVGSGAKHVLYTLFQVLLNPGDEVIIPAPYWVSYPEQVKLAEGNPVIVQTDEEKEFKVTPDALEAAISESTKAFIINSPSNPTGVLYDADELRALGEVCLKHDILIISDEIYDRLIYGEANHVSIAQLSEELKKQTLVVNGVSKTYAMTGWRIGYAAGDSDLIKAMTNLASHSTSNPATVSQCAAIAALEQSQEVVEEMRQAFEKRLNASYERLIQISGITCVKPKGAFYLFPNVKEAASQCGYDDVSDWAKALLEEKQVAIVPGEGFGSPDNVRLSYATSLENMEEALERIETFIKEKAEQ